MFGSNPVPSRYCASQYAVFDPRTFELRVANAGLRCRCIGRKAAARPAEKAACPQTSSILRVMSKLRFGWLRET